MTDKQIDEAVERKRFDTWLNKVHKRTSRFDERQYRDMWEAWCAALERQRVPEKPLGAIHNGEVLMDRLENDYSFECVAGPLSGCQDWQDLQMCFNALREYVAAAPEIDHD